MVWTPVRLAAISRGRYSPRSRRRRSHRRSPIRRVRSPSWSRSLPAPASTSSCGSIPRSCRRSARPPIVVENRPGNAGLVAVDGVKKAAPDGYTLLAATSAAMAIRPSMIKKPTYDPNTDFIPVVALPEVAVRAGGEPGPADQIGAGPDRLREVTARQSRVQLDHRSAVRRISPANTSISFGVQMTQCPTSRARRRSRMSPPVTSSSPSPIGCVAGADPQRQVRALAVTSTTRLRTLPDVPSFAEASGIPDFEAVSWHMLFARQERPRRSSTGCTTRCRASSRPRNCRPA